MYASSNPPSVLGRIRLCSLPGPRAEAHWACLALLRVGLLFHSYYIGIISLVLDMASSSSPTSDTISIQLPAISGYPSLGHTSAWREEFPPSQGYLPTSLHYYQYTILILGFNLKVLLLYPCYTIYTISISILLK